jgi:hypothetical protein
MDKIGLIGILSSAVLSCAAMFILSAASDGRSSAAAAEGKPADAELRAGTAYAPVAPRCVHDSCVCSLERTNTVLQVPLDCVEYEAIDAGSGPSKDGCCAIGDCDELPCEHYYLKVRYRLPCIGCCPLDVRLDWDHGTAGSGTSSVNCGQWTAWTGGGWNSIDCNDDYITHTLLYCGQVLVAGYTATETCWECDPTR